MEGINKGLDGFSGRLYYLRFPTTGPGKSVLAD